MTERVAKVEDLDVIKSLKRALWKFAEVANVAMTDAESEMNRALMWLEHEQLQFWQTQLRKRAEHVERCKEAVRMKKLFKDSSGRTPSAVDEEKALRLAIRKHEEAEEKLTNVKKYTAKLRKEILMYKGHVQRFATAVQNDLPWASAQLDGVLDRLQQYLALNVPQEVRSSVSPTAAEAGPTQVSGGMSRGSEGMPVVPPEVEAAKQEQPPERDEPDEPQSPQT